MILGTAGHVDHGKTALVKALTGVDTDRLSEEKRRGITIDLGFAPLALGDGLTVGVVDVPGHEAFVRNMLAGATGVDLALLVVAADEGVMPQTREHLAILSLLGVRAGIVALTKCDLVDDDWLELVREDVRALVAPSPLREAPLVPTSVPRGDGLAALRDAIAGVARALPGRDAADLFRLPVDRSFSVRGTGTVVTGTVWSGRLDRDGAVRILPSGRSARVRGIESHGHAVGAALPGMRAAIALAGVDVSDVRRGTVLVSDAAWEPSLTLLAEVALLGDAPSTLGPRTAVRFHLGTTEVGARVVAADGALRPGMRAAARVVLDGPVVARAGDRFVLRASSPLATIGGGVVHDPAPSRRRVRPWRDGASTSDERVVHLLADAGAAGVEVAALSVRAGVPPAGVGALVARAKRSAREVAGRLYAAPVVDELVHRVESLVDEHHARAPLDPGVPLQWLRARLSADPPLADHVLGELQRGGTITVEGALAMRAGWAPRLATSDVALRDAVLAALAEAGREPPSTSELVARHGEAVVPILRLLEREGRVVQVEGDRFYARGALDGVLARLRAGMAEPREYTPAELREVLGVSRKYLIPLLEYCDREGITMRRGAGRALGPRA